jgi:hypothetical protein
MGRGTYRVEDRLPVGSDRSARSTPPVLVSDVHVAVVLVAREGPHVVSRGSPTDRTAI